LNGQTVAAGRAFRHDSGARGAAAKSARSTDGRENGSRKPGFDDRETLDYSFARSEAAKKFCAIIRVGRVRFPLYLRGSRPF